MIGKGKEMPVYTNMELWLEFHGQRRKWGDALLRKSTRTYIHDLSDAIPEEGLRVCMASRYHIPILIVVPLSCLTLHEQVEQIRLSTDSSSRCTFTDVDEISGPNEPKGPYFLLDVDDGTQTLGKSSNEAIEQITLANRSPLTVSQGVALGVCYPPVLLHHNLRLAGSMVGGKTDTEEMLSIPSLEVESSRVTMTRDRSDGADARWGTPSYKQLVSL